VDLLKVMMTLEEGQLVLALFEPATPQELAKKLNLDEKVLADKLDNLAHRGLLFRGKTQYVAWKDAHQITARTLFSSDAYIPPALLELRRQDNRYTNSPYAEINGWIKRFESSGVPIQRAIPDRKAILASPNIPSGSLLWYEDIVEMIRKTEMIGVTDCACRRIYHKCDKPVHVCLHFGKNMIEYETGRDGRMKVVTFDEAVAISDVAEEAGLVHTTPGNNASVPGVICNCCDDCCSTIEPALQSGKLKEVMAPSRFRASVNPELCKGCQVCVERCFFEAVEMQKVPGSKKMKATIINEKCMGCGSCVVGCKAKALTLELVRPPEFIPAKPTMTSARFSYDLK
jgi:Na+-translocating ferredoxin:NAD+ oxidoreductase subunit B